MDKTFGFDTAVEEAQRAINSAYIEVGFVSQCQYISKRQSNEVELYIQSVLALLDFFLICLQARSAYHGIGLVKLMGRSSGFIAMHASLSSGQIDVCLIPEVCKHNAEMMDLNGLCFTCTDKSLLYE